jgi:hypothetical protein
MTALFDELLATTLTIARRESARGVAGRQIRVVSDGG